MGFLKKFFQTASQTQLELVPKAKQLPVVCANESLKKPQTAKTELSKHAQDERINTIEAQALFLGWTWEQLWRQSNRYDHKGLASMIKPGQSISAVTLQYIQLESTSPTGKLEIQRFYNHETDQPWLKRNSP